MCAHAWLEQRNREVREIQEGVLAVVATAEDYRAAYDLIESVGGRSVVNLGETHRKIVRAVYDLKQEEKDKTFPDYAFGVRAIAEKAGISPGTVSKNKTFLTKSAGLLYEPENSPGKLSIPDDAEPSWWEDGDVMEGFPAPAEVEAWEEPNTSPPNKGNDGNEETVGEKTDAYAEKPVSEDGNTEETVSADSSPHRNGHHAGQAPFDDVEVF
jgi:hypothetical protein